MERLMIIHGGGPTAVMNSSLYGAVKAAQDSGFFEKIYAAQDGTGGLLKEALIDLTSIGHEDLELLKDSPGTAIGTSRDPLAPADYAAMAQILLKHGIHYVLFNGGNGTMDTCGKFYDYVSSQNLPIKVMGIPKTMDNDLAVGDHSPGFPSAAQYVAQSVREVAYDVQSLPIHVVVIETSGRNAGWLTAAAAMADLEGPYKPDLIYLPERPFSSQDFLRDVEALLKVKKGILVVASEGLVDQNGQPVVPPVFTSGRATYFGDVSTHLANLVIQKLGYKARGEKPGLLGRASITMQSPLDVTEAIQVGHLAVQALVAGQSGQMIAIQRKDQVGYQVDYQSVPLKEVMLVERKVPDHFINAAGNGVTQAFIDWCKPLISPMKPMISFKQDQNIS